MCYIKHLKSMGITFFTAKTLQDKDAQEKVEFSEEETIYPSGDPPKIIQKQGQNSGIERLSTLLKANSALLSDLNQVLGKHEKTLQSIEETVPFLLKKPSMQMELESDGSSEKSELTLHDEMTQMERQIFRADTECSHMLRVKSKVSGTIYKERNMTIEVELVDSEGNAVRNANMLHLCLGVRDANGEWINENSKGDSFMKGNTEVELYHGKGTFAKVYPKDVSRRHPGGKVSFIIYAKPSVLKCTGYSALEKVVEASDVQPVEIANISIKAKKRD